MAEEPIAFHLYKKRHFEKFKKESEKKNDPDEEFAVDDDDEVAIAFKKELLRLANAKLIGRHKFLELLEETSVLGYKLDNYILNLTPNDQILMRSKIMTGIKIREEVEKIEEERKKNYYKNLIKAKKKE